MKIICDSQNGYLPRAVLTLTAFQNIPSFHREQGLRHPLAIYNVSLYNVVRTLNGLLNELEQVTNLGFFAQEPNNREQVEPYITLADKLDMFYNKLMSYFDDCLRILRCFVKKDYKKNSYVKVYEHNIEEYHDHVAIIYNKVKHQQYQFRAFFLFGNKWVIPGYLLETVDENGYVGPALDIHKRYKDRETAFSFNRLLKFHLWGIYMVSECLSNALIGIIGQHPNIKPDTQNSFLSGIASLITRVAGLPYTFFNDEQSTSMPVPTVKIINNSTEDHTTVEMTYPDQHLLTAYVLPGEKINAWMGSVGDGISNTYRPPYFPNEATNYRTFIEK